jgi:S1-C subfamily serine protease
VNIKKVLKATSVVLALITSLAGAATFFRGCNSNRVAELGGFSNRYESAQHKTVLVVSPDGSQGTGIVIKRGDRIFVWTAAHVVYGFDHADIKIVLRNGPRKVGVTTFSGRVLALESNVDVALLYVDAPTSYFVAAEFESPVPLPVGSTVYHVGNFLGIDFDNSVSTGIVSQIGVNPGKGWPWAITDQTTCSVVPGSSGGPLFSDNDKVAGIIVGLIPERPIYVYVPVRVIEVWADSVGLSWAIRGNSSPLILPIYTAPKPVVIPVLPPPVKKK